MMRPCELCGAPTRPHIALLREPWSANRVTVVCCTGCAARAWRTIDIEPPAISYLDPLPENVLRFRRRA